MNDAYKQCVKKWGESVQSLRLDCNLSQATLAANAHVPLATLRNWEQGRGIPNVDAALRLAAALGVTLDVLVAPLAALPIPEPAPPRRPKMRGRPKKTGPG